VTSELKRLRKRSGVYVAPTNSELVEYRTWFSGALKAIAEAKSPPPHPGFSARAVAHELWLFAEQPHRQRGAGALLVRTSADARNVLVEAPHTFFDVGTLDVAVTVFHELRARALLINTVHRTAGGDAPADDAEELRDHARSGTAAADLAHAPQSFYLAAHRELVEAFGRAGTVQLHGFRDEALPGTRVVVSAAGSTADARAVQSGLAQALGPGVHLYPVDVKRLGGTTNVQARASIETNAPFLHLELSRSLRSELVTSEELRVRFARALAGAISPGAP
jgi:hypothetical protein